jgi:hypothetical protein
MNLHPVLARARSSAFARMEMPAIRLTDQPPTKTRPTRGSGTVGLSTPSGSPSTDSGTKSGSSTIFNVPGNPPAGSQAQDLHGAKIGNVSLQVLFWGSVWQQPSNVPSAPSVMAAVTQILNSMYLSSLAQYGVAGGSLAGPGVGVFGSEPPNPFSVSDVSNFVWSLIDAGNFPQPDASSSPNLYMVIMPPGVNSQTANQTGAHSVSPDVNANVADNLANDLLGLVGLGNSGSNLLWSGFVTNDGTLDTITTILSHELAEAATDPNGDGIQMTPTNPTKWNEIGDACQNCTGPLDGVAGNPVVQAYFSKSDNACLIPSHTLAKPVVTSAPDLPPGSYQISYISLGEHNGKTYIWAVGGMSGSTPWVYTEGVAMKKMLSGAYSFYTEGDGERADVYINDTHSFWFLETVWDDTKLNNLRSLPSFPPDVFSDPNLISML